MSDQNENPEPVDPAGERGTGAPEKPAGAEKEKYTPDISDEEQHHGETQRPAADDDVGVPESPETD
jgi:hypothetical protein